MQAECTNPNRIKFTVTLEYDLEYWLRLKSELEKAEPGWNNKSPICQDLINGIEDLVRQAEKHFYPRKNS